MSVDTETATGGIDLSGREFYLPDMGRSVTISHAESGGALVLSSGASVGLHNGVALPMVGEFVAIPREAGVLRGYWLGCTQPATTGEGVDRVRALLLTGTDVVEHSCEVSAVAAGAVVVGRAEPGMVEALTALRVTREELNGERRAHEDWKDDFRAAACQRADEQNMCSQFDDFMESWGLEGRSRTWSVAVDVTTRVWVSVDARTAEDAEEQVDRHDVESAMRAAGLTDVSGLDYEVRSAD